MGVSRLVDCLDRIVAIKTLRAEESNSQEPVERFRSEAQALAALRHPNIVAVHSVRSLGEIHYFAMDFVEGTPLDRRLQTQGSLPQKVGVKLCLALGEALSYAASCSISVLFNPAGAGKSVGTLAIPTNDPEDALIKVPLSGTGYEPEGPALGAYFYGYPN